MQELNLAELSVPDIQALQRRLREELERRDEAERDELARQWAQRQAELAAAGPDRAGERYRCPTCGHRFDPVCDVQTCPTCREVCLRDGLITDDDDYAWCL